MSLQRLRHGHKRDTATPYAPIARAAALALDGEVQGGATLFLDGRRTTVGGACLANSALFHGRAQEDTCGAAHFGTILIPLLTALIEARRYPLAVLIPAVVAGYEAGGVIEKALSEDDPGLDFAPPPSTERSRRAQQLECSWSFRESRWRPR